MICDIRWVCSFMFYFLRDKLITEENFTCIRLSTSNIFWFTVVPKRHSMWLSYLYSNHGFMHHCIIVATHVVIGQMVLNVTLYMQLTSPQNWSVCLIYRISVLELYPYYPGSYIPGNCYWQNKQHCFSWNINKPLECCDRSMVFDATCSMCSLLALPHHVSSFTLQEDNSFVKLSRLLVLFSNNPL